MKIIAICGSPRRGNTEFILKRILTKLEERRHQVRLILLREKKIQFCDGCLSCDKTGKCKLRDDMQTIYPQLEESDLIIFGSPNYFSNVSGMMKNFIDRLDPFCTNKKLKDKKIVAVVVGALDTLSARNAIRSIKSAANAIEASLVGDLYLVGENHQDIENNPDNIKKIDEFAENLAE